MTPRHYRTTIRHRRRAPIEHGFTYRSHWWLVDVDHLPRPALPLRPLLRFEARDHLGDPRASLRQNVEDHLAAHGIDLDGGTITLLAAPRSLGYAFNPLSVFWCRHADGNLAAVLAEVANTYGGRHVYLLRPDDGDRARVDKAFYVSPFHPVEGHYTLRLPEPGDDGRLDLSITLHRPGQPAFVATVTGQGRPVTGPLWSAVLAGPATALRSTALIRWQGLRLWWRRVPVVPRPATASSATSSADDERADPTAPPATSPAPASTRPPIPVSAP